MIECTIDVAFESSFVNLWFKKYVILDIEGLTICNKVGGRTELKSSYRAIEIDNVDDTQTELKIKIDDQLINCKFENLEELNNFSETMLAN